MCPTPVGAAAGSSGRLVVTAADIARATGSEEVAARLKPYQLVGINYLLQLAAGQVGGAILADEMGLGKTAQSCVYLCEQGVSSECVCGELEGGARGALGREGEGTKQWRRSEGVCARSD